MFPRSAPSLAAPAARRYAQLKGGWLRVIEASPRVQRVLALTRLDHVLMPAALPDAMASSSSAGMPDHRDRAAAVGDAVLADRTEEHARELTVAVTPDDDEISGPREGLEHWRRVPLDN